MRGELHRFLTHDHARLDGLLREAIAGDPDAYREFRSGLLWHIGVEEKILFPLVRAAEAGAELIGQLHRDHAALAALLVPPANRAGLEQIRAILEAHNQLEEEMDGFYDLAEEVAGGEAVMEKVRAFPPVRLAPHADTEITRRSIEQLVLEAEQGRRSPERR